LLPRRFLLLFLNCFPVLASAAPDPFSLDEEIALPCASFSSQTADGKLPPAPPLPRAPLSLAEVIDLALCHNPKTRAAWANTKAEAAMVGVATASYLPSLDSTLAHRRARTRAEDQSARTTRLENAGVSLSYLLFDFGGRAANLENRRQLLRAALAQQDVVRQTVFLEAAQAFYQRHAADAAVTAALATEEAARQSLQAADARHRAGMVTPVEKLQAETAFSRAVLNRVRLEGQRESAAGILANALGFSAHQTVPLVATDLADARADALIENFATQLDDWMAFARAKRPDLAAAHARYQAAEAAVATARSQGLPSLHLAAGADRQWQDRVGSHSGNLTLTLNVPLFSGFADSYRIRAAEASREAAATNLTQLTQQASLDVWQAWQALKTATQSIRSANQFLAAAEAAEHMTRGRYRAGVGNLLDLLNAQSASADARMQQISAFYDWHISRATLARALGFLDERLLDDDPFPAYAP
jgi:outer membrane protein TolC